MRPQLGRLSLLDAESAVDLSRNSGQTAALSQGNDHFLLGNPRWVSRGGIDWSIWLFA